MRGSMETKDNKQNHSASNKDIINTSQYNYLNIEEILLACTKIQNNVTGEEVLLNPSEKMLYVFMRKRYEYFKEIDAKRDEKYKKNDRFYYPNETDLAEDIGVSESTIKRAIKSLRKIGLIKVEKSGRSNYYQIEDLNNATFTLFRAYKGETITYAEYLAKRDALKPAKITKPLLIDESASAPVDIVPEQSPVSQTSPSFNDWDDDEPDFVVYQPKQATPYAAPSNTNKYYPGDIDLFGSDTKSTFTPQEPKQTTIVKDEEVKYLGLIRRFMCYWDEGMFEGISDFKKGMEIFKPLVENSLKKPIAIPEDFYECLTNFNDDVADKWGIPF